MKPPIVLLISFCLSLVGAKLFSGEWSLIFSGNLAMGIMLLFTAIGHFAFPKGMALMLPKMLPFKTGLVYLTGFIEIVAAIGLQVLSFRHLTALLLIIFFIAILPANIYAALHRVNLEKGTYDGNGASYLWFRVPLQLFFIGWVWYFSL